MIRALFILFSTLIFSSIAIAQQQFTEEFNSFNEVIETNNPDYNSYAEIKGLRVDPVKWVPYNTDCKQCQTLTKQYNNAMQDLFNVRGLLVYWESAKAVMDERNKNARIGRDAVEELNKTLPNVTVSEPEPLSEEEAAAKIENAMFIAEFNNHIPVLKEARDKLELTTKNLRKALTECEAQCVPPEERKNLVSLPPTTINQDPQLPFN